MMSAIGFDLSSAQINGYCLLKNTTWKENNVSWCRKVWWFNALFFLFKARNELKQCSFFLTKDNGSGGELDVYIYIDLWRAGTVCYWINLSMRKIWVSLQAELKWDGGGLPWVCSTGDNSFKAKCKLFWQRG